MRTAGVFVLHVEPETPTTPARVSLALSGAVPDQRGVFHVTRPCMTLDDLEGCINALEDELEVARADARRMFAVGTGHA